jgi:molybdopterin biosynthesis enzyme
MGDLTLCQDHAQEPGAIQFQNVCKPVDLPYWKNRQNYIFGLPGNPVSSFINFEVFAKPFCFVS